MKYMLINHQTKVKSWWVLVFFLTSFGLAQAQPSDTVSKHSFSLSQAVEYALAHQNDILNASLDELIAQKKVAETIGIGLPQVNASAGLQDYLTLPTTLLPGAFMNQKDPVPVKFGVKYQSSIGLDVSQLLFDGSYLVGLQAAKTYKELSVRNTQRTKIEAAVVVTKAYYNVLVARESMNLVLASLEQLQTTHKQTSELYKNGFAEKVDVDRLEVLLNNTETDKENLVKTLALSLQMLKYQMGMPAKDELILSDKISDEVFNADIKTDKEQILNNRVEYGLLQTQKKLSELDLKRYRAQFLPTLAAFGSFQKNFQNDSFRELYQTTYPSDIIGVKLTIPIIQGGQRLARIAQAKYAMKKAENNIEFFKKSLDLELENAQVSYLNSINVLNKQKKNMELSKEILRVSKVKYEQGVGSSLEVIQAQTELKSAENNYIKALFDITINKVNLDKALGNFKY